MERYVLREPLGRGSYGSVWRAVERATGKSVAIKQIYGKFDSFDDVLRLSEVRVLRRLRHPNIVALKEVIRQNDMVYLVYEVMESNLHEFLRAQAEPLPESTIRSLAYRLLVAVRHVHACGYFHRDLKSQNVLLDSDGSNLKLADFGIAREIRSKQPLTGYVSTRWYRAPEVLLRASQYSTPIDMWAVGLVLAELFRLGALLPGDTDADQLHRIAAVLGSPSDKVFGGAQAWREGVALMEQQGVRLPETAPTSLAALVPRANADALDLIASLLRWDPAKRLTAAQCLRHSFFAGLGAVGVPRSLADMRAALVRWARSRSAQSGDADATSVP